MKRTAEQQRKYERDRATRLLREYQIVVPEYDAILAVQGGVCAICQRARGATRALQVDHNHALEVEGKATRASIRGLLCGRDNNRLGWFEAKQDVILDYLSNPPARGVLL